MRHELTYATLALLTACSGNPGSEPAAPAPALEPEAPPDAGATPARPDSGGGSDSGGAPDTGTTARPDASPVAPASALPADWIDVTANLKDVPNCSASFLDVRPDRDMVLVDVWKNSLFATTDGGASWNKMGSLANGTVSVSYDPDHPDTIWESGMYGPAAYRSDDGGATWKQLGTLQHVDVMGIDFTDPQRRTLVAGAHEQSLKLYRSSDGGATWTNIGTALPPDSAFSSNPVVLDARTFLVGCSGWSKGKPGVYRTTDGGATFTQVSDKGAAGRPLRAKDGTIYWPVIWDNGLLRSTDQGQTFTQVVGYGVLKQHAPIELPDGRLVAVGKTQMVVSADQGKTWTPVSSKLPFDPRSFTYSPRRKAFFITRNNASGCQSQTVVRYAWDYEAR